MLVFTFWQPLLAQTPPSGFSSVVVSSQWNEAVGVTFNTSGTQMFVWERGGRVWVVENSQKQLFLDISEEVGGWRDFGLLGFALHPQFDTNGYFYLLYTVDRHHLMRHGTSSYSSTTNEYFNATIGRVTRYTATKTTSGYNVNPSSRKILLGATRSTGIPSLHESHGVGSILFGTDGSLLISAGDGASYNGHDGGSASDTYYAQALTDGIITSQENVGAFRSQLLESYNGKILRIDPETGNGLPSNPYFDVSNPNSVRSKVWALGLRNPFRMSLKPGSGSTNPADGRPGALYVADVGFYTWEDLNVVTRPGMNFGWPIFEGLTQFDGYANMKRFNYHAPNPLYGTGGCTQQYFYFQDLIKQETASGTASFTNPCNSAQAIPSSIRTFLHSRPIIDWRHSSTGPSRTGTFSGETATVVNIGATGSPVSGPQFGGNAAVAGVFYTKNDFPPEFRNTFFFGDYSSNWIRNITTDASDKPTAVRDFINSGAVVVHMATHPTEGGVYYVNFPSEIRRVTYKNRIPVAVASSDKTYGSSPLTVQFTGSNSYDPDGQNLTYLWDFGDGNTSTLANPSHTFTTSGNTPTTFTVTLTVKDPPGGSDQTTLKISLNNTPPQVTITSPADNTLYPINSGEKTYELRATVTDQEHSGDQLSYSWQTILHHEDHEHPESPDTSPQTTTTISPLGCGAETYYYRITLTVTDAAGLSTKKEVKLYPDCNTSTTPIVREFWGNVTGTTVASIPVDTPPTSTSQLTLFEGPSNVADNYGSRVRAYVHPPVSGDYIFWLASDDNGELWLSTDENPANRRRIAYVSEWTNSREWTKFASQKSVAIPLQAGRKYYIEALQKEEVGGDNLAVGWTLPDGGQERPIPGIRLSPFAAPGNQMPAVTITSPANNASFTAPASITIVASASDADGTVAKVEFFQGSAKLWEDTDGSNGWSYAWSNIVAGSYSLTARATDNAGEATTSAPVNITITEPTSTLMAPSNLTASVVSSNQNSLSWQDNSPDEDGFVLERATKADFTSNLALINLPANATSYLDQVQNNKNGGGVLYYRIKAVKGVVSSGYSNVAQPTASSNQPPTVTVTSPLNYETFTAPATITINANASDSDGTISKVEFFQGTTWLGEDATSPYSFTWSNVPAGTYQLTARAMDNGAAATTSAVITVQVRTTTSGCFATGEITREYWTGIKGSSVSAIPITQAPNATSLLTSFEAPSNAGNNYGQRIRGYICAPSAGSYIFYIASDDESELWLSTNDNPANKQKLAYVSGTTLSREWTKSNSQKSITITLEAGQRYYIEALHKEDRGGDHLAVGWTLPGSTAITVIGGEFLSPFTESSSFVSAANISSVNEVRAADSQAQLMVYPNPPTGEDLYIEALHLTASEVIRIILYNSIGEAEISYTAETDENGSIKSVLRLPQQLSPGVYTLLLQGQSQQTLRQKIIIVK